MYLKLFSYFLIIVVLMYFYIILLRFFGKTLLFIYAESRQLFLQKFKRTKPEKFRKTFGLLDYLSLISENFFLSSKANRYYWILFVVGNIVMWQYFRYKDMSNTVFEHKKAREYYALSHHLLSYHMGLTVLFRNPDSFLLKPVNLLQDAMIDDAKKHLPENDGEIAMYHYMFKLYPYMQSHYYPSKDEAKAVTDLSYQVLKEFSTLPIKDKEVREYSRYRLYPMAAEYFIYTMLAEYKTKRDGDIEYIEKVLTDSYKDTLKQQRLRDVGMWSLMHFEGLKKYERINDFIENNHLIEIMYISDIVVPLREVMLGKVFHFTFRCDDELLPMIYKYIDIYNQKYYTRPDENLWGYRAVIVNKSWDLSNISCALCEFEPIRGTYVHKSSACYPKERDQYYDSIYWQKDPQTHQKWFYRVRELKKVIKKNNINTPL